jgi:hypothetical protein
LTDVKVKSVSRLQSSGLQHCVVSYVISLEEITSFSTLKM